MTRGRSIVKVAIGAAVAAVLAVGGIRAASARSRPVARGVTGNALGDCPGPPNCVSSFAREAVHRVEPLRCRPGELDTVVEAALGTLPRTRLMTRSEGYAHLECRTPLLGFRDDLELLAGEEGVHVRSASRWGRGDLGVNRRRVEALRTAVEPLPRDKRGSS